MTLKAPATIIRGRPFDHKLQVLNATRRTIHNKYHNLLPVIIPLFKSLFQKNGPSYIPDHYKQMNPDLNLKCQPLRVIIASSPFLQRGSQYTPRCHHHPKIAWSVGGEMTLQEEYYYSSLLGHVIEIQDVWATSRVYQLQLMNEAPGCSWAAVVQAYLEE